MGWMKDGKGIWGDEPQDIIDAAIAKMCRSRKLRKPDNWPTVYKKLILKELLSSHMLKAKFDKPFFEEWGRKGTMAEFRSHIITALGGLK